jgi:pimeloyl-ACP methyl ester carboxylesterase
MVLADTRAQPDAPQALEGRQHMIANVRERGVTAAAEEMLPKLVCDSTRANRPDVVTALREMILENSADAVAGAIVALMTRPDSRPLLRDVRCPTLVVVGEQDAITPPAMSEEMQRLIPGADLAVIPDAGHMSNMEQPAAFNVVLGRFLERRI